MEETSRALAGYHDSRLTHDPKRDIVWRALWRYYFRHRIGPRDTVLDLGCGHGEFINNVVAGRRIALDMWPDFPRNIAPGVETIVAPVTGVSLLENGAIDFAFASNLFEHVTQNDFAAVLATLRAKLSPRGSIDSPATQLSILRVGIFRRLHPHFRLVAHQSRRFLASQRL